MICALSLYGCGSSSSTATFEGILQSVQSGIAVPVDPVPVVTVVGRSIDEFEYAIAAAAESSSQVAFSLKGLPVDQDLVFQVSGSSLETVLSFPKNTSLETSQSVPVLAGGSISAFIGLAEDPSGININVDPNLGIVAGVLKPSFNTQVVSTTGTVASVRMVQKDADTVVVYQGPYYFNGAGDLVDSVTCPDAECNYIFYSVPAGLYRFQQLDAGGSVLSQRDVVVLASQLTFGME